MMLFILVFIFFSNPILAFKKKDSLNLGKALLEEKDLFNAGTWDLYMAKCSGRFHQQFRKDLAALSWADFINYTKGKAKYDNNYTSGNCSKEDTDGTVNWFNWIISELERKTNGLRKNTLRQTIDPVSKTDSSVDEDSIEFKLKQLKKLFDKNLITENEYAKKRQEIIDNF